MALELESTIMDEIGLGNNYRWYNGSGSCGHIRAKAVAMLPQVAGKHNLIIPADWLTYCQTAIQVDQVNSREYGLTNTWVACSYAIREAMDRSRGDEGRTPPVNDWVFWSDKERGQWELMSNRR